MFVVVIDPRDMRISGGVLLLYSHMGCQTPCGTQAWHSFYVFVVSVRLTSACRVGGTQLDSRKKISIYSNLRVPICEVRRIVYGEEVLPGGKHFAITVPRV